MWGNVESTLQRRMDLVPNLVEAVKGYKDHEASTLQAVVEARQQVNKIQLDMKNSGVSSDTMQKFMTAQNELSGALSRLLVTVERYPDLKANQTFQDLMTQLEGTENRINVARQDYNEAVQSLNVSVRNFFGRLVSGFSGVQTRTPFNASEGANDAPKVSFE